MILATVVTLAGLCGVLGMEAQPTPATELEQYLNEAAENHPALERRHAEWLAALERLPQVSSLDDPTFMYGQFLQSEIQRARIQVTQKFPWFGTLGARKDKAAAEADAVLSKFFAERDALFLNVKQAYFDYAFLAEQTQILCAQIEIVGYIEEVIQAKLSLALATDDELLRVSILKTDLTDQLDGLEQLRPALSQQLSSALGRTQHEMLDWPIDTAPPGDTPVYEELLSKLHLNNPSLQELDHRMHALEIQEELARKKGYPDITLGIDWTAISKPRQIRPQRPYPASLNAASRIFSVADGSVPFVPRNTLIDAYSLGTANEPFVYSDGGEDNLMISLAFNVPLWRKKIKAGIRETEHMQSAVQSEMHALELDLENAARMTLYRVQDASRRHALIGDSLIPQAQQTYESLLEKYAADALGKTFIDILDSVQMLLDFQLEQSRTLRDWKNALAEIDFLTGTMNKVNPESNDTP